MNSLSGTIWLSNQIVVNLTYYKHGPISKFHQFDFLCFTYVHLNEPIEVNDGKPIGSMYGISTCIYHKNQPNVGKYNSPMDPMGNIPPDHEGFCFATGSRNDLMHKLNSLKGNNDSVRNSNIPPPKKYTKPGLLCWDILGRFLGDFQAFFNANPQPVKQRPRWRKTSSSPRSR